MFNAEVKEQFMEDEGISEKNRPNYLHLFNTIERFEDEWGKDVCTMGIDELLPKLNVLAGIRASGAKTRSIMLRKYGKWCLENHIPGAIPDLSGITLSASENMKKAVITSPAHLQKYLDAIFDPEEAHTIDNVYRAACWAVYSGFTEDEAYELKCSDVDFNDMMIHHGRKSVEVYRESLPSLRECVVSLEFNRNGRNGLPHSRPRVSGDLLLRGLNKTSDIEFIRSAIIKRSLKAEGEGRAQFRLSISRLHSFGYFYRTFRNELAGIPPDYKALSYELYPTSADSYEKLKRGALLCRRDYNNWKEAALSG